MSKPTIIKGVRFENRPDALGYPRRTMVYTTDVGDYTLNEIAAICGMTRNALALRMRRYGTSSHLVFKLGHYENRGGAVTLVEDEPGNDLWRSLGGRPRPENLHKIKLGAWEKDRIRQDLANQAVQP